MGGPAKTYWRHNGHKRLCSYLFFPQILKKHCCVNRFCYYFYGEVYSCTPWVKKRCHPNHGYNFTNSWSVSKILSLLQRPVNFQQYRYNVAHRTLSMLLHYLGKLKNQKFAILMHVKHVSNVTFYHLSNSCQPNIMKINVKINAMQNTNILLFVRLLSLRYWRNA